MTVSTADTLRKHFLTSFCWAAPQILQCFHLAMSTALGVLSCPHLSSQYPGDDQFQQVRLTEHTVLQRSIKSRVSEGIHEAAEKRMERRAAVTNM